MIHNSVCQNKYRNFIDVYRKTGSLILGLVFSILLLPSGALATAPRTSALGGDNTFFEDDSNVLQWYGSLSDYGNQVVIETGHHDIAARGMSWSDSQSGFGTGVHAGLGSEGKFGTAAFYFHEHMRDGDASTSISNDPGNSLTMMYGRKVGPVLLGVVLKNGSEERTVAIDTVGGLPMTHREFKRTTVGVGLRADLSASSYLDVAFDMRRLNWLDPGWRFSGDDPDSWANISFRTRVFFAMGANMAVVPVMELWSEDYSTFMDIYDQVEAHNNIMLRLGCGLNYFPNSDNFMLVSANYLGFQDDIENSLENEFTKKLHQYSLLVATETRWNHWLTLRASIGFDYFKREDNMIGSEDFTDTIFPMSFGAGFHLGGFDLDVALASHEPGLINPNWDALYSSESSPQAAGSWFSASLRYLF